jgi:uncharacterized protein (TIGR00369 family)
MNTFSPKRNDYETILREHFDQLPMHRHLGITLGEVYPGYASATMPRTGEILQQNGFFHAGALITLADSVAGAAAVTLLAEDENILSVNITASLLRAGDYDSITGEGRVIKAGKRFIFTEAILFGGEGAAQKELTRVHITMAVETIARG